MLQLKEEVKKRVQVWCTGSSEPCNLGMPPVRRYPLVTPKEGSNAKRAVKGDFHASCHGNQRWPEKMCHHGHQQKISLGMYRAKSMCELGVNNS